MDDNLKKLLNNQHLGDIAPQLCDFSLEEQNAATEAQGVQPSTPSDYVPVLGKSVTIIVACVIINEYDEILMMQEAKQSCAGKWYLPAGRMEKGETVIEAARREVFEETGLNVNVTTILGLEAAGGSWFRFVLTGEITGGQLKTPAQADKESLQAKWIQNVQELSLRANDILNLISLARAYKNRGTNLWHNEILPVTNSHHKNFLRVIAVIRKRSSNSLNVLVSEKNSQHFPTVEIHPAKSLHSTLRKFMIEIFGSDLPQHRPHGILTVEHQPSPMPHTTDGICISILVAFRPPMEEVAIIGKCVWHELPKNLEVSIGRMLNNKNTTIPLNVVR
ncbi:8-oxo-dGDP phosphatase NUDT18 [Condylostylus longicornis]|uniref:8-oxo-dGDP phosphatase NUDT18 n=1 Tax=Condylostylus longicornis TaxID=2530218 RepID=UPI00244DEB5C|nr:8-oxo-dGDP phosphatase NUDT18 [Condylostylus longicornis]XP_055377783.1 8-oxo-dGDP phosphatase NUDT18 [Condylostylus longicornis]XP_055377784.1 8-oxo-dGDP phosphatase NUDT18 [Condylostylus longicornis]